MTITVGHDTLKTRRDLSVNDTTYTYYSIEAAAQTLGMPELHRLPVSLKVVLENLLRHEDGLSVHVDDIKAFGAWVNNDGKSIREISYRPARVLMQDFTGVPAIVDLAAMRDAMTAFNSDPEKINPLSPVDLVIDHSVMVDAFGHDNAFAINVEREYERNQERYTFLKWGQSAFNNFRVVPPGTGICHQVNLEYLAQTVWTDQDQDGVQTAYPDTLVGTDSHTTMVNGLAVLGWGVGGIEAEAAMLGQPISMLIPEVVGFELVGKLPEGTTATDLVLTVTQLLRAKGVVGKFVEFYGDGLDQLPLADRATLANMAPEYGATCGFFPIDNETLRYLHISGREEDRINLVKAYAQTNGLWREQKSDTVYTDTMTLDIKTVEPSLAGPKRPQDRIVLSQAATAFSTALVEEFQQTPALDVPVEGTDYALKNGHVVIAAITSCTNTSNPSVMIAAGLVARKAAAKGLNRKPWVKTSLAPGSQVVTEYLEAAGLQDDLDTLGFDLVGYGCTTCIGNSGPLPDAVSAAIQKENLVACSVLSGNRNFEGRVNPDVQANYLASPPLVVAYAILGSMTKDITTEELGRDQQGNPVYLKDIWPTSHEIAEIVERTVTRQAFKKQYANVFTGDEKWQSIITEQTQTYNWQDDSTYVQHPPYFENMHRSKGSITNIEGASILALLGDSITTDHISPAGSIKKDSPAGRYLSDNNIDRLEFNSYGARRGNHEVMMRGTFANIRIRNEMLENVEGGYTRHIPSGEQMSIYDAAMVYKQRNTPLVVIAGKEYGTGSSRDWAAKGTILLGVKAVVAESFERIHRSNLVGMGVVPLQFQDGVSRKTLNLTGAEKISIQGLAGDLKPRQIVQLTVTYPDTTTKTVDVVCRIDTEIEIDYVENGGVLHYVLRQLAD